MVVVPFVHAHLRQFPDSTPTAVQNVYRYQASPMLSRLTHLLRTYRLLLLTVTSEAIDCSTKDWHCKMLSAQLLAALHESVGNEDVIAKYSRHATDSLQVRIRVSNQINE